MRNRRTLLILASAGGYLLASGVLGSALGRCFARASAADRPSAPTPRREPDMAGRPRTVEPARVRHLRFVRETIDLNQGRSTRPATLTLTPLQVAIAVAAAAESAARN